MLRQNLAVMIIVLHALQAHAQASPMPPPLMPMPQAAAPATFGAGDQFYELSVSGIAKYMDVLEAEEPQAHAQLRPAFDDLVFSRNLAWGSALAGVAVGGLMIKRGLDDMTSSSGLFTAGIFTVMFSPGLYYLFRPSYEDYLDFINQHNRINRKSPLRFGLDVSPNSSGVSASLAWRLAP